MPHGHIAGVAGDFPSQDPLVVLGGNSNVGCCGIAINLLVGDHAGDARRGTALLVADGHFKVVRLAVRGLGTAVGVRAVFVGHGGFEGLIAISFCGTDTDNNAVGTQQGTGDVPSHGDGTSTLGFSAKSANGGVRDGGLSEFAAHEDHLSGWDNGAVSGHVVGEHIGGGVKIGGSIGEDNPLARAIDVPQRCSLKVL